MSVLNVVKKFPKTFWIANTMEIMERWAWYGMFAVLALYLTDSTSSGALGFSQTQKGTMMGVVTALLYLMPLITGAIADRFGYKKILMIAFAIISSGYFMMGSFTSYGAVFFAFTYLALGAALFKPVISATVSKTTTEETSSIGFGVFYMMVNIGGFLGPIAASKLRNNASLGWHYVFWMSTVVISLNFIFLIFFYKDPSENNKENSLGNPKEYALILFTFLTSSLLFVVAFTIFVAIYLLESPFLLFTKKRICFKFADFVLAQKIGEQNKKIFKNITTLFEDSSFIIFLILIIGFWSMFNQIFYTLPNFIEQWVDTSSIYNFLHSISPVLTGWFGTKEGTIPQEMMINLDAGAIIVFQIVVSSIVMRFKPLNAMISGILISSLAVGLAFYTHNGWVVIIGIFIFSIGEMASSPKITEYIGKIAPKDKVALYMGTSFLPVAGGNLVAGILSGPVYEKMSDKITLLHAEILSRGLSIPEIGSKIPGTNKIFSKSDYIHKAAEMMGVSQKQLTQILWDKYNPSKIWIIFTAIGLTTVALLFVYDRFLLPKLSRKK